MSHKIENINKTETWGSHTKFNIKSTKFLVLVEYINKIIPFKLRLD